MRLRVLAAASALFCATSLGAQAQECAPSALGTSRTLEVPASTGPVGSISYKGKLPLEQGEVVLTFDDGPMPRKTPAVLEALKRECVRATFFVVGTMVRQHPEIVQQTADDGHTLASHSWSHAYLNRVKSAQRRKDEINGGLLATSAALGGQHPTLSPFFRFPGLGKTRHLDAYIADQNLISMSADIVGDDWLPIGSDQVLARVMQRLKARGRGIILLHDIQKRTVDIVPDLLNALKAGGYKVVHVVPAPGDTRVALARAEMPASARIRTAIAAIEGKGASFAELHAPTPKVVARAPIQQLAVQPTWSDISVSRKEQAIEPGPVALSASGGKPASQVFVGRAPRDIDPSPSGDVRSARGTEVVAIAAKGKALGFAELGLRQ